MLDIVVLVAVLTVIFGLLAKVVGFPDQIRKNYKRKSTEGLSTIFIVIAVISYILWTIHGFFINDWVLIVGQGLGIVTTGVILIQILHYRKKQRK